MKRFPTTQLHPFLTLTAISMQRQLIILDNGASTIKVGILNKDPEPR